MIKNKFFYLVLLLVLLGGRLGIAYAQVQGKLQFQEQFIASAFKTLAKSFVSCSDTNKLKGQAADRINNMTEERFVHKYSEIYEFIGEIQDKNKRQGFTPVISRKDAVKKIYALDKNKIIQLIDGVPDKKIVEVFNEYLSNSQNKTGQSITEKINGLWKRLQGQVLGRFEERELK